MQSKTLYIGAILEREILSPFFLFYPKKEINLCRSSSNGSRHTSIKSEVLSMI